MNYRNVLHRIVVLAAMSLCSIAAHAGVFRAYISSTGNDANACTLQAPCRLLSAALAAVNDGGEIWMLDSANYNTATVNIAKSVSILAVPGAVGSVLAINGPAISITTDNIAVALRNLVIVPLPGGGGTNGVEMVAASKLTIEGSLIANHGSLGVFASGTGKLEIANTIIRNNTLHAVEIENGMTADIASTKMLYNGWYGVRVFTTSAVNTKATVSDSVIAGNFNASGGVSCNLGYGASGTASIFVTRSTIHNAYAALVADIGFGTGSTLITVSDSMIANNNNAWYQSGGGSVIRSMGNNHIADNFGSVGTLTTNLLQ